MFLDPQIAPESGQPRTVIRTDIIELMGKATRPQLS